MRVSVSFTCRRGVCSDLWRAGRWQCREGMCAVVCRCCVFHGGVVTRCAPHVAQVNLPVVLVPPGEKGENAAAPLLEAAQAGMLSACLPTPPPPFPFRVAVRVADVASMRKRSLTCVVPRRGDPDAARADPGLQLQDAGRRRQQARRALSSRTVHLPPPALAACSPTLIVSSACLGCARV
eukprot:3642160-Rhodomonas_salina.2